jgi:hypothetical protein
MTGSTATEADRDFTRWRSRAWPLFDIRWRRFLICPTLRKQSGASSTNSSRIFFCCRRRDENSVDGFWKAWLRCPKVRKQEAPDKRTRQGPAAPLAHRRPGYPLSGCVPAEPDSVSPGDSNIAFNERPRQLINDYQRSRSRLRTWLRTQILDIRWQLLHKLTYPPLTPTRPHSSHSCGKTSSAVPLNPGRIQQFHRAQI